jgi:hypothetical protein
VRLRLALDISLGLDHTQNYGGFLMSDNWAATAADKLRKRDEAKIQEDAVLLQKDKLRMEQSPALWEEIRNFVKVKCDELNTHYGDNIAEADLGSPTKLTAHILVDRQRRTLTASFHPTSSPKALNWYYENKKIIQGSSYGLAVVGDRVVFQSGMAPSTPESIARQMLDGLLAL